MELPIKTAHAIYMMIKRLEPIYQCGVALERDIRKNLNIFIDGDAMTYPSKEARDKYIEKMNELANMDVEFDVSPVRISIDDVNGQRITPSDIRALEGFVLFSATTEMNM